MKSKSVNLVIRLLLTLFALFSYTTRVDAKTAQQIANEAFPSVVLLVMEDANGQPLQFGSGFFVDSGMIATNFHVIEGAYKGYAKPVESEEKHPITGIIRVDTKRDLVLLSVQDTTVPPLKLRRDSEELQVGDEIYVVGNPQGFEGTFSEGIVSGIRKVGPDKILQITAPISPGSSGGPVLDSKGNVIGVAVATVESGQNLNFAIPSNYLLELIENQNFLLPLSLLSPQKVTASIISEFGEPSDYDTTEALFVIKKDGFYGYIDRTGKIVIDPKFGWAGNFNEGLARVKSGNKWGYIDRTGKIVLFNQFDGSGDFSEGLALIIIGERWGYINKTGEIAINPQFNYAGDFHEGLAEVKVDKEYGYIDKTGKIAINPQFNATGGFHEGLAFIKIGEKYGYIDKTGKIVIIPQFDAAGDFHEGLAKVKVDKEYGYIYKTGKIAIKPQFDAAGDFHESLAEVKLDKKYGYIDKNGNIVIKPRFDKVYSDPDKKEGLPKYLGTFLSMAVTYEYLVGHSYFSEGLAVVKINDKYGYIDRTGIMVINPQFECAFAFSRGLAKVIMGGKLGYIDNNGHYIWIPTM